MPRACFRFGLVVLILTGSAVPGGTPARSRAVEEPADPQPAVDAGKFLVARRELPDPNFAKTVVLLLRHDDQGTSGLIINRPTEMRLSALLPDIDDPGGKRDIVYEGGPVSRDRVVMLLRSKAKVEESRRVFDDVHVSRSDTLLRRLIGGSGERTSFRVYSGHSGWAPGQLAAELERGDWHLRDGDAEMVFDESPHEIWKLLLPPDPTRSAALIPREERRIAASPE